MNIAIDLDSVLFINNVAKDVCDKYGVDYPRTYNLDGLPEDVKNECYNIYSDKEFMCSLRPYPESIGIDKALSDAGHNVYVITSRDSDIEYETKSMILKYFKHFDGIYCVGEDKTEIYKKLDIDVVIDDNADHIYSSLELGIKHCLLLSNDYTTYNEDYIDDLIDKGAIIVDSISYLNMFIYDYERILNG